MIDIYHSGCGRPGFALSSARVFCAFLEVWLLQSRVRRGSFSALLIDFRLAWDVGAERGVPQPAVFCCLHRTSIVRRHRWGTIRSYLVSLFKFFLQKRGNVWVCIILERIQWNEYYYFHRSGGTRLRWSSYRHYCVRSGVGGGGGGMSIMLQHACYFLAEKNFEQKLLLTRIWIVTFRLRHKDPSTECIHAYWCLLWEFYGVGTSCTVNLPRPYLAFPNLGTFALPGTTGAPFFRF